MTDHEKKSEAHKEQNAHTNHSDKKEHHKTKHKQDQDEGIFSGPLVWVVAIAAVLILFNQIQLFQLNSALGQPALPALSSGGSSTNVALYTGGDLGDVDVNNIQSTAQAVAATFDFSEVSDAQGVIDIMIPTGVPTYGEELGISYDDPVQALEFMAYQLFPAQQTKLQQDPEKWQRYVDLTSNPRGISCEFCCGVGPVGTTPQGQSRCGCSHNPGVLALTMYLIDNTDWSDAEILREAIRWKSLWFPKNMVEIGLKIAGGDSQVLESVPTMVGGC